MEEKKLMFHEEVDSKVSNYNVINGFFLIITVIGGALFAYDMADVYTSYSSSSFDDTVFITTLLTFAIPSVLLFIFFKLLINIYGEKVRGNFLKQMMLEKMNDEE